jgi:hypothetical protein
VTLLTHRGGGQADASAEMVIPRTPRVSHAARLRALRAWLACALLVGCTSIEGPTSDVDQWKESWKSRAGAVADGAGRGAVAVGDSLGTAYQGVREGFEEPHPTGFGPYPEHYAGAIKHHMQSFEGVPQDASFEFRRPVKGFTNKGILAGGAIEWQGYVVDVRVETRRLAGQKRTNVYVVRMSDGHVVEVLDADYAAGIQRLNGSVPAAHAD